MGRSGLRTVYWSYRRLARTSFQVAGELASRGLGQGDRLLLREDNSPEWVATFLGCLMRGVVVVPLDAQSSPEFIAGVERQTRPKIVLGGNPGTPPEDRQAPGDSVVAVLPERRQTPPDPGLELRRSGHCRSPGRDRVYLGDHGRAQGDSTDPPKPALQSDSP